MCSHQQVPPDPHNPIFLTQILFDQKITIQIVSLSLLQNLNVAYLINNI